MWCGPAPGRERSDAQRDGAVLPPPALAREPEIDRDALPMMGRLSLAVGEGIIGFSNRLEAWRKKNPRKAYFTLLVFCIVAAIAPARAMGEGFNFLNGIDQTIMGVANPTAWMGGAIGVAQGLFLVLAGLTFIFQLAMYYGQHRTFVGTIPMLAVMLLNFGVPYLLISNAGSTLANVTSIAQYIAGNVTGTTSIAHTPSDIATTGGTLASTILQDLFSAIMAATLASGGTSIWGLITGNAGAAISSIYEILVNGLLMVTGLVCAAFIFIAFVMIALEYLMAHIQILITLPARAWTIGLHGAPVTAPYAGAFWGVVIGQIVRFIVILEVVLLATQIASGWVTDINGLLAGHFVSVVTGNGTINFQGDLHLFKAMLSLAGASIGLAWLVRRVGDLADGANTGGAVMGGAGLVGAAYVAKAQVANALTGGSSGGSSGSGGGVLGATTRTGEAAASSLNRLFESTGR